MSSQRLRAVCAALLLLAAPVAGLVAPEAAHATGGGTFTWSGGGSDGLWSDASNWVSVGGTAPQSGDVGDTVIINNAASFTHGSTDDLASLSLATLEFENDSSSAVVVSLSHNLTITGAITQEVSDTATNDSIYNSGSAETITIGGNVVVTSSAGGLQFGDSTPDNLSITDGDSLNFVDSEASNIVQVQDNIVSASGTAVVTYTGADTTYELSGVNTYAGTTNVNSDIALLVQSANPFGTSTVDIATSGMVEFESNITSLSNTINIDGSTSSSPPASLDFNDALAAGTFAIPNIVLTGDTAFENDASPATTVDLAGITANGHCVEYNGSNGTGTAGATNSFANGPASCAVASGAGLPKAGGLRSSLSLSLLIALTLLGGGVAVAGYNEYSRRRKPF